MNTSEMRTVEQIRSQYGERTVTKLDELKALDKKVKLPARLFAYLFGAAGSLVLGTGMCLAMQVIGSSMSAGIGIGLLGIAMVSVTYPLYQVILKARKKKYADAILALSDAALNA